MIITGKAPSIICNELDNNDGIVAGGNDIDLTFSENGTKSYLYGISIGNGKWEISELDDSLALFPEYSEGDVISFDVLKKAFSLSNLSQSAIFSFNLLGKVKYGLKDYGIKKEQKKRERNEKIRKNIKKFTDFFTDDIDKETAQNFLRKSYNGAKVGYIEKYNNIDGANFKVLFGVPSEKKYYVGLLHRNGNNLRLLDEEYEAGAPLKSFTDSEEAYSFYQNYPDEKNVDEPWRKEKENVVKDEGEAKPTDEKINTDFAVDEEGNAAPNKGYHGVSDGVAWEVTQALKKKKKSKYNGCNVTGYEDGTMLNMASNSFHVFSRLLFDKS